MPTPQCQLGPSCLHLRLCRRAGAITEQASGVLQEQTTGGRGLPSSTVSVISTASSSSRPPSPDTTKRQRRDSGWGGELGAANSPPALPAAAAAVPAAVPVAVPPVVCVPLLAAPPLETNTRVPPQGSGHAGTTTATPAWGTAQPGHSQPKSGGEGRQAWTSEEDRKIFDHVLANGAQWSRIAEKLPDRTDDAVRARYKRLKASETAKRGDMWSPEEDAIISNLLGARWHVIAEALPGRSANAVRNRHSRKGNV
jgi:hypothetical protein